jgi:hypothetical protein
MTKPPGVLRSPKEGRPSKASKGEERYRHRNFTLPQATDDRLREWGKEKGNNISDLINKLLTDFLDHLK